MWRAEITVGRCKRDWCCCTEQRSLLDTVKETDVYTLDMAVYIRKTSSLSGGLWGAITICRPIMLLLSASDQGYIVWHIRSCLGNKPLNHDIQWSLIRCYSCRPMFRSSIVWMQKSLTSLLCQIYKFILSKEILDIIMLARYLYMYY